MTFENGMKERLLERTGRLIKLLESSAPKTIIANEIALILDSGIGYCGPDVLKSFGELMVQRLHLFHGYCAYCENELDLALGSNMCSSCKREADAEIARAVVD